MQFPSSASTSYLIPASRVGRLLRVLVVGPELLASALHALLGTLDDIHTLTPIYEPDQVLPFLGRVASTGNPVDVVVLHLSGDFESDFALLHHLAAAHQHCLVVTSLYIPSEIKLLKSAGARGLFLTSMPAQQLASALRIVGHGRSYFPKTCSPTPGGDQPSLTKPRLVAFHEDRLRGLARERRWEITDTEVSILRHFTNTSIEQIAANVQLRPATVRRELSERIYKFLSLLSGRSVPNRFVAIQVVQEYGILEYIIPPRHEERARSSSRKWS